MNIKQVNTSNNKLLILLTGEMDANGCSKIRPDLEAITEQHQPHIVLDISGISFIDSSGIGAIVFLFKRLKEQQRSMGIIGVQGQPHELMTLLHIDSAIPLNSGHDQEVVSCVQ